MELLKETGDKTGGEDTAKEKADRTFHEVHEEDAERAAIAVDERKMTKAR